MSNLERMREIYKMKKRENHAKSWEHNEPFPSMKSIKIGESNANAWETNMIVKLIECTFHRNYDIMWNIFLLIFFPKWVLKTDVLGVYDRPPAEPNAVLLREISEQSLKALDFCICMTIVICFDENDNFHILQLWMKMEAGLS